MLLVINGVPMSFSVPTEEEGDPENKAGNDLTTQTTQMKIFADSKESIYVPIEESPSNIFQDSGISGSATEVYCVCPVTVNVMQCDGTLC